MDDYAYDLVRSGFFFENKVCFQIFESNEEKYSDLPNLRFA